MKEWKKARKTKERKLAVEKPSKIDERNFKMRKEAINIRDENKLFFFLLPSTVSVDLRVFRIIAI